MSIIKLSDNQLLDLYRGGESSAISTLIERHTPRIRNYIRLLVKNQELAEDLLQDVLIKTVKMIDDGRYTESGRFLSWVMRIAHNISIDHFRANKNRKVINETEAGYDIIGAQRGSEGAVEDSMILNETQAQIRELIELLPDDQREVVKMRYYQDLSFKEIAETSGVSINTALGRMRYALINLRKLIKENKLALA